MSRVFLAAPPWWDMMSILQRYWEKSGFHDKVGLCWGFPRRDTLFAHKQQDWYCISLIGEDLASTYSRKIQLEKKPFWRGHSEDPNWGSRNAFLSGRNLGSWSLSSQLLSMKNIWSWWLDRLRHSVKYPSSVLDHVWEMALAFNDDWRQPGMRSVKRSLRLLTSVVNQSITPGKSNKNVTAALGKIRLESRPMMSTVWRSSSNSESGLA